MQSNGNICICNEIRLCYLADADLLSYGRLGDETIDTSVSTYRYKADSDLPLQVTATVSIGGTGIIIKAHHKYQIFDRNVMCPINFPNQVLIKIRNP